MPFQPSPKRDGGYDIADCYGVDPDYGSLGDFVAFTRAAKQRGLRVLIDLVVMPRARRGDGVGQEPERSPPQRMPVRHRARRYEDPVTRPDGAGCGPERDGDMARTKHLPPDATIADVLPGLDDGEAYVREVLATMRTCQKHYGDAWVRICVTAKAGPPSYRIDRSDAGSTSADGGEPAGGRAVFGAYGGRSHDRFTQVNTAETRWSSRALGMAEMLKLHDGLRRPKGTAD